MTIPFGKGIIRRRLTAIIVIILITLAACSTDSGESSRDGSGQGELQVLVHWQTESAPATTKPVAPSGNVCVDFKITWIRIKVKDPAGKVVANSALVPCGDRRAQLDNIPARKGYKVEVEGLIDDLVQWHGSKENVTVSAGRTTDPVMVFMSFTGKAGKPPAAEITPVDAAVNVPTERAVLVNFDKPVVPASVNADTIRVFCGDRPVAGSLTYIPETYEAVFQPDESLPNSTTCTVTVTTNVMDHSGQSLARERSSKFTTTIVWYVDSQIPKSGTGKSWKQAFGTIAEAVSAAGNGHQIWVKQGTYQPGAKIVIDKPVVLLGGFAGTELHHHERDWTAQETVVDGKREHRCFFITSDATIDGFTITGGFQSNGAVVSGVAMSIEKASPRIINCQFIDNSSSTRYIASGGAVFISEGDPYIRNCTFKNNKLIGRDGAKYVYGGAICNVGGGPKISDCIFQENSVEDKHNDIEHPSLIHSYGGAIYNIRAKTTTTITNCHFDSNTALGNNTSAGGAIYNTSSAITISNCRFSNNGAEGDSGASGGAVNNHMSGANFLNCTFWENYVRSIEQLNNVINPSDGGAISNSDNMVSITNCTFALNKVIIPASADKEYAKGGAIANFNSSNVTIVNSIVWDNSAATDSEIHDGGEAKTTVSYSCIYGEQFIGNFNFWDDPRLNPDLHLRFDSPCRGKAKSSAAPKIDIDPRHKDNPCDVGADQFIDQDNDHMQDYWEKAHQVDNSDGDEDGDGLTNLDEYQMGTNPNNTQHVNGAIRCGNVRDNGEYLASESNTLTGEGGDKAIYRSFFVFDLSKANPIKDVLLRLELVQATSNSESIEIWDVATGAAIFSTDTSDQTGTDIYSDLGEGVLYRGYTVEADDTGTTLLFRLNTAAVAAVNSAIAGSGEFIIGVKLRDERNGQISFGSAGEDRVHQLVLIEE